MQSTESQGFEKQVKLVSELVALNPDALPRLTRLLTDVLSEKKYDIFLIHSGFQKAIEVSTLYEFFCNAKFTCFYDDESIEYRGYPREAMESALETCRHAVVVISEDFLASHDPRAELKYISERREWILQRQSFAWESLWIVLYKVSAEQYKKAMQEHNSLPGLPDLPKKKRYFDFDKFQTWPKLFHHIKQEILKEDKRNAKENWETFLKARERPRVSDVYK